MTYLGWSFKPSHEAVLLAELLHLDAVVGEDVSALIALVGEQHGRHVFAVRQTQLGVEILLPFRHRLERRRPRDVKNDKGSHGLPIIHPRHVSETLLACRRSQRKAHESSVMRAMACRTLFVLMKETYIHSMTTKTTMRCLLSVEPLGECKRISLSLLPRDGTLRFLYTFPSLDIINEEKHIPEAHIDQLHWAPASRH